MMMERVCAWAEVVRCVHARVQACGAAHPVVASVTELIVGLCKRESNQPRPGVAPGDPQHEAEGWTSSSGAESMRSDAATRASDFALQSQDTVEMTYSRLALNKRGLLTTAASTKSQ